ncbi:MAG: nucleotidyltransferase domain-containing protein [candidate division WOR-3 bacterium]
MTDLDHARLMIEHALALVSWETERPIDTLREALRAGDNAIHSLFRYRLAGIVARELGKHALKVYVYGSPMENRGRLDSDIDLLVVARRDAQFARRLLQELDRALTWAYAELVAPAAADLDYLLDFHLVTESDVRRRRGYAALITDPRALPPEKIYDRTADVAT